MKLKFRHLLAYSAIASFLLANLAGCSAPPTITASGNTPEDPVELIVELPKSPEEGKYYLENEGKKLYVGDAVEQAFAVYPRPDRSFAVDNVPESLSGPYEAKGWETTRRSFGIITTKNKVAVALLIDDRATDVDVQNALTELITKHGEASNIVEAGNNRYWFWDSPDCRLMLCTSVDEQKRMNLALALGNPRIMTVLRMNSILAQEDVKTAQQLLIQNSQSEKH